MYKIPGLTADAKQNMKILSPDGAPIDLTLEYRQQQRGWFFSLTYLTFSLLNRRLVISPNMLRQFQGVIPFGIAANSTDGGEPVFKDDFLTGRVTLYILEGDADKDAAEARIQQ